MLKNISIIVSAFAAFLVAVFCVWYFSSTERLPVNATSDQRRLFEADRLARLGNWAAAHPIYVELENRFRQTGDKNNELHCHYGRYHLEQEYSNLLSLSESLEIELRRPEVKADPRLRLRCLEAKGQIDLNLDGLAARPAFEAQYKLAKELGNRQSAARASGELAIIAFLSGNASQAKKLIFSAIASSILNKDIGAQIRYLGLLGAGLVEHHRPKEALWFVNQAINLARRTEGAGLPHIAIVSRVSALTQLKQYQEAESTITEFLDDARSHNFKGRQVDGLVQLAQLRAEEGRVKDAIKLYERANILASELHFNRGLAEINAQLTTLYQKVGDIRHAAQSAQNTLKAQSETGEVYLLPHHLGVLARLQATLGDWQSAENIYSRAENVMKLMLRNAPTPGTKKALIAAMSEIYQGHFELQIERNNLPRAFHVIEEARGRAAADRLADKIRVRVPQSFAEAASERKLLKLQIALLNTSDPSLRSKIMDELPWTEANVAEPAPPPPTEPLALEDVQATLGKDEVVVEYVLGQKKSYAVVLSKNSSRVLTLPPEATIEAVSTEFLNRTQKEKDSNSFAQRLFQMLLEPIEAYGQSKHLVIVPDGILHAVPFTALRDRDHFVVETHDITICPSSSSLALLRRKAATQPRSFLAVADVSYQQGPSVALLFSRMFRGLSTLQRDRLPSLPGTADELSSVALLGLPGSTLSKEQATEGAFKRQLQTDNGVIHLGVHGIADRDYPDRAALVFASEKNLSEDGLLQVREIRSLDLSRTNLVTLTACDTNVGRLDGQEGISSIVYAFLYAGSTSTVATLWKVEDTATATLVQSFYRHLKAGDSTSIALQKAQIEFVQRKDVNTNPLNWAGFTLLGDGARPLASRAL